MGLDRRCLPFILCSCLVVVAKDIEIETQGKEQTSRQGKALNISKKPCHDPSGKVGICTFKWDCISQNGTLMGTCVDGFIFGTCCLYSSSEIPTPDLFDNAMDNTILSSNVHKHDSVGQKISPATTTKPKTKPTHPSSVSSPGPQLITWTAIGPTENVSPTTQNQRPLQISPFPFPPGSSYPQFNGGWAMGVAFPVDPFRPNRPLQYLPPYPGASYFPSNQIIPSQRPTIPAGSWTIFNGGNVVTQSSLAPVSTYSSTFKNTLETTTIAVPIPQWMSSTDVNKNDNKISLMGQDPNAVDQTIIGSSSNQQTSSIAVSSKPHPTVSLLPVSSSSSSTPPSTLKPHHSPDTESLATTTEVSIQKIKPVSPQKTTFKKPVLDYRKDCGVRSLSPKARIVGGYSVHFGKWPWQILVKEAAWLGLYQKNKCGGVLISSKYAITAGHCQPGFLSSLVVLLGEYDLTADYEMLKPEIRRVKRMVVHRHYNPQNFDNDIAVLELDPPVVFKPHISPICLPEKNENFTGKMAYVSGWGKTSHGGAIPNIMQEVQVPIMSNSKCRDMFKTAGHIKAIKDTFVCAGYSTGGKDSCEGDSGGPLMVQRDDGRWVLVGTVSHGIRCADPNLPGVYMRISAYRSWIDKIIKS